MARVTKADWLCRSCKRGPKDLPLSNYGTKMSCRGCKKSKGACYLRDDVDANAAPTRRVPQAVPGSASYKRDKELQAVQAKVQKLEGLLASLQDLGKAAETAAPTGTSEEPADKDGGNAGKEAISKGIDALRATVTQLETLQGDFALPEAIAAARCKLGAAIVLRDEAKPPATRILQAQRLVARRQAAAAKATTVREKAAEALWLARQAVDEATAAETTAQASVAEAQRSLDAAVPATGQQAEGASAAGDAPWDLITAVLTQLDQLPTAIRAGNGETAWASMQNNGVKQLQDMVLDRVQPNQTSLPDSTALLRIAEQPARVTTPEREPTAAEAEHIARLCAGVTTPGPLFPRSAGGGADPFKCDLRLATQ